ncbi:helix-turn-helix transcriptional regulator [Paraburkholderia lycopersici]|uniref:helix-turn-helix transcriptional regulator n=1 Tax=Paraburkholderia lycopersici TaxID=416944 RepID=UPI000B843CD6|nr:AlpA family phage regulatory protein [Paraburkholderia lycopersici]
MAANSIASAQSGQRIVRIRPVLERIGISKSELYRRIAAGTFPKQVALGPRAVGFLESDIDAYIASLPKRGEV